MPVPSDTPSVKSSTRQSTPTSDAVLADARQAGRVDGEQRADADDAENRPEHAAGERQHDALGQQLAHDAAAARADGGAHGNLAPPAGRAHEQQVGDVRAGDQQHEADGADEHQQRRADVGDERFAHRHRREDGVLAERVGELRRVIRRGERQPRVGLLERHAGREARGHPEIVPLVLRVRIELERQPDLRVRRRAPGSRRSGR